MKMNINWTAVVDSFRTAGSEIVAFRGAHPIVAAVLIAFACGWLVAFCTFHGGQ